MIGKHLASFQVWSGHLGRRLGDWSPKGNSDSANHSVTCVALNTGAKQLAAGTGQGRVYVFDVSDMISPSATVDVGCHMAISGLCWNSDGSKVIFCTLNGLVKNWTPE